MAEFGVHGKATTTLRHVLTHTVGLPAMPREITQVELPDWSRVCESLAVAEPRWRPGAAVGYHSYALWLSVRRAGPRDAACRIADRPRSVHVTLPDQRSTAAGLTCTFRSNAANRPRHDFHRAAARHPADSEFCYQLHKAAMGDYVTAVWGWDERRQRGFHTRSFNPGRWQIIAVGQADIGVLDVEYRPGGIYISRIEIHPDYQGQGIGTLLISTLADEARRKSQALVLDVLTINHRAQTLYKRLGMKEVARHGDNNIKITMRLHALVKSEQEELIGGPLVTGPPKPG